MLERGPCGGRRDIPFSTPHTDTRTDTESSKVLVVCSKNKLIELYAGGHNCRRSALVTVTNILYLELGEQSSRAKTCGLVV